MRIPIPNGEMLYRDPWPAAPPDVNWIDPQHWSDASQPPMAGRGAAWYIETPIGAAVLRHFRRGGLAARISRESYLFTGADECRSFAEFRLLETMFDCGLPVPEPLLASYQRHGLLYRAALMTRRIENVSSLVERYYAHGLQVSDGERVGAMIRRFHDAGVDHADLNAHNILMDDNDVYVIDFDRGRMRSPGPWRESNLKRLERSLAKLAMSGLAGPIRDGYAAGDSASKGRSSIPPKN